MPRLHDLRGLAVPLVAHVRQPDVVVEPRNLVRHKRARKPPPEIVVEPLGNAVAVKPLVVFGEAFPKRIEIGAHVRADKRKRQRLVARVVIDRASGPKLIAADKIRARADVGRPVAVERERLVKAPRHARLRAAKAMCEKVAPEQAAGFLILHELAETAAVFLRGEHQQPDALDRRACHHHHLARDRLLRAIRAAIMHHGDFLPARLEMRDHAVAAELNLTGNSRIVGRSSATQVFDL